MKKILSMLLFTALIASCFISVTANENAATAQPEEAVSFLQAFKIMEPDRDNPGNVVTREDFALYVARMLKIDEFASADDRYFVDLDMEGYNTGVINTLTESGIISQSSSKEFRPAEPITANEALKMVLCALGYGEYSEARGGFPLGYARTAGELGLSISGETVTVAEAAELIAEAMQSPIYTVTGYSEDGTHYSSDENQTVLSVYHNILFEEGTVEAVYMGSITGKLNSEENAVSVNGKNYTAQDSVDTDKHLADYVKIFYIKDIDEIVYIERQTDKDDIVIDIEEFVSLEGNTVKYYQADKIKSVSIDNLNIIYNGMPLNAEIEETFDALVKGSITIKDSDDDGNYDIILVDDYSAFVVSQVNTTAQTIYNELNSADIINIDDYENVKIISGNAVADFSVITKSSVISVAKSKNKEILKLWVSNSSGKGVLTQMKSTDGKIMVCIGDEWYTVDKQYAAVYQTMLTEGNMFNQSYVYKTDVFGDIAYFAIDSGIGGELGYIIAVREDGVFDKEVKIKLLTGDGEIKVIPVSDKIEIDGTPYKEPDRLKVENAIADTADAQGNIGQLIRYVVSNEKINVIDTREYTATEDENNTLVASYGTTAAKKWYSANRLGVKGITDTATVVFCVPFDASDINDEDCAVLPVAQVLQNNGEFYADAYRMHISPGISNAMVLRYTDDTNFKNYKSGHKTYLVEEISTVLNDDGSIATLVSGYENGAKTEYRVDPAEMSFDGVEKGDLIKFNYNVQGNPTKSASVPNGYVMLYKQSNKGMPDSSVWKGITGGRVLYANVANSIHDYYNAEFQLSFGYASDANDNVVSWGWTDPTNPSEYANCASIPVIVIEETDREIEIYRGKVEDIAVYENAGADCSRVIYQAYSNTGRALFVYK